MKRNSESQRAKALKRWGNPETRFWNRVQKGDGCWLWKGCKGGNYGLVRWNGIQTTSHRVAFLLSGGKLKPGEHVCHKCDTPLCCRPDHLFAGTAWDNVHDCIKKGRNAKGPQLNHGGQKGEKNPNCKTPAQVIARAKQLLESGMRQCDVMRETGLTRANVWCIAHGKSWNTPALLTDFATGGAAQQSQEVDEE